MLTVNVPCSGSTRTMVTGVRRVIQQATGVPGHQVPQRTGPEVAVRRYVQPPLVDGVSVAHASTSQNKTIAASTCMVQVTIAVQR